MLLIANGDGENIASLSLYWYRRNLLGNFGSLRSIDAKWLFLYALYSKIGEESWWHSIFMEKKSPQKAASEQIGVAKEFFDFNWRFSTDRFTSDNRQQYLVALWFFVLNFYNAFVYFALNGGEATAKKSQKNHNNVPPHSAHIEYHNEVAVEPCTRQCAQYVQRTIQSNRIKRNFISWSFIILFPLRIEVNRLNCCSRGTQRPHIHTPKAKQWKQINS